MISSNATQMSQSATRAMSSICGTTRKRARGAACPLVAASSSGWGDGSGAGAPIANTSAARYGRDFRALVHGMLLEPTEERADVRRMRE
jgi:hypothetical protein